MILGPQKSRQNGQLAFESGATSESGGTCPRPNVDPLCAAVNINKQNLSILFVTINSVVGNYVSARTCKQANAAEID